MTGGLSGLQSALVAMAVPLSIMMLIMCYSTYKGLNEEVNAQAAAKKALKDNIQIINKPILPEIEK